MCCRTAVFCRLDPPLWRSHGEVAARSVDGGARTRRRRPSTTRLRRAVPLPTASPQGGSFGVERQHRNLVKRHRHMMRSEEHTHELQSLMHISYAVFCLNKKK